MLEDLHVKDVALVREATLEFGPGLTVMTGETGAGKTALLSALKLLIGERATSIMVRDGANELLVESRFVTSDLSQNPKDSFDGETSESSEIIVKRRVSADGRSKCSIDDEMATVGSLQKRIGPLLDLHGQHEHQKLLKPASHVRYLDSWIGAAAEDAKKAYLAAKDEYDRACKEYEEIRALIAQATHELEEHRIAIEEIQAVSPVEGEYEELSSSVPKLQHGEQLVEAASSALTRLRAEGASIELIVDAQSHLRKIAELDESANHLEMRLSATLTELEDIASEIRTYRDAIEADPAELARVLDRLGEIDGITKRFGPRLDDVFARLEIAEKALAVTQDSDHALRVALQAQESTEAALRLRAEELARIRHDQAASFSRAISNVLTELEMSGSSIQITFEDMAFENWTNDGSEHIEFLYQPAPSVQFLPLTKIASGGEISRVMLALKTVLCDVDETPTLVFDEIDAGVGGAVALKVGENLKKIAARHQVIVVTHLAQVAAFANTHVLVEKGQEGDDIFTSARVLNDDERVHEIARMLSGSTDEVALEHARQLVSKQA